MIIAGPMFRAEMNRLADLVKQSVVTVISEHGNGAGVVWARDVIATNDHVSEQDYALIRGPNGREIKARAVVRNRNADLVLLIAPGLESPAAEIGDSKSLQIGELVGAIGHPLGLTQALSLGVVSGNSVAWGDHDRRLIQADLSLSPGNSGGPIFRMDGSVVGIACMIHSPGIALAIPSYEVSRLMAQWPSRPRNGVAA